MIKNQIISYLHSEILAVIKDHKSQSHRIIFISGLFSIILKRLNFQLGVGGVIATPLAVENGHYTGKILHPLNIGQCKVERLKQFLEDSGKEIDLAKSNFYTDSIVDAPVMGLFAHPVAVYPDSELARLAAVRKWPVIVDYQID